MLEAVLCHCTIVVLAEVSTCAATDSIYSLAATLVACSVLIDSFGGWELVERRRHKLAGVR